MEISKRQYEIELQYKIISSWFFLAIFIFFLSKIILCQERITHYKKWLKKEVTLIITEKEKEEFNRLETNEERDRFIEIFWAKRDPTPNTARNEFKEEYYQRLSLVIQRYQYLLDDTDKRQERKEMGKVVIIFGFPKKFDNYYCWIYNPIPRLGLSKAFKIVFRSAGYGGRVFIDKRESTTKALEVMENYAEKTIINPDVRIIPTKKVLVLNPNSFEGKALKNFSEEEGGHFEIPFGLGVFFKKWKEGKTLATFLCEINEFGEDLSVVTCFGRFKTDEGEFKDFKKNVKLTKKDNQYIIIMNRQYQVFF